MSNTLGVVVGLTYTTIPYAALPIYSVLENMEWEVVEAARDLGAGRVRSFVEVVIPQAIPGIIVSTVLTLVWNFGAYAAPGLLGSGSERMLAQEIEYFLYRSFWPKAAALSIVMLVIVVGSVVVLFNLLGRRGGGVGDVA
jgi:spermidine/putrescine transport system permease protein